MSSLQALSTLHMTSKTVLETAEILNKLAEITKRLTIVWIKAHVGHEGNEGADILAKGSTELKYTIETPQPNITVKNYIKEKIFDEWTNRWSNEPTCRQTKLFFPKPSSEKSKKIMKLARSQLSRLVEITTGHNSLAYHASKQDPSIDPLCSLCEESTETFFHFITECPRLRETRVDIFPGGYEEDTWATGGLLEFARIPAIETLLTR